MWVWWSESWKVGWVSSWHSSEHLEEGIEQRSHEYWYIFAVMLQPFPTARARKYLYLPDPLAPLPLPH